jgi:hypothetical protein
MNLLRMSISLTLCLAGCSSSSAGSSPGTPDSGSTDGAGSGDSATGGDSATDAGGDGGGVGGSGSLTGTYGTDPIKPVAAAYWIGQPSNPAESGGGPFIYVFSGPVSCDDLSHGSGWRARIPAGTQVLEMIVGTTMTGTPVPAAAHAAANVAEVNYSYGQTTTESRATAGSVTLTAYAAGASVDGTVNATFPMGSAMGTFHAVYCATGNEL